MNYFYQFTIPDAEDVYLNDEFLPFTADDVQEGFEKLVLQINTAASPGYTWERGGNCPTGTYLLNGSVASNLAGRLVTVTSSQIVEVYCAVGTTSGVTFAVEQRVGLVFTELLTLSIASPNRVNIQSFTYPVSYGDELAVKVKTGAAQNVVFGILIKGVTA